MNIAKFVNKDANACPHTLMHRLGFQGKGYKILSFSWLDVPTKNHRSRFRFSDSRHVKHIGPTDFCCSLIARALPKA